MSNQWSKTKKTITKRRMLRKSELRTLLKKLQLMYRIKQRLRAKSLDLEAEYAFVVEKLARNVAPTVDQVLVRQSITVQRTVRSPIGLSISTSVL